MKDPGSGVPGWNVATGPELSIVLWPVVNPGASVEMMTTLDLWLGKIGPKVKPTVAPDASRSADDGGTLEDRG